MNEPTGLQLDWLFFVLIFIAVLVFGIEQAMRKAIKTTKPPTTDGHGDGPGRYRVGGVDRDSKLETEWLCEAQSRANAEAKGRLEGIEVTKVEKLGEHESIADVERRWKGLR